jgi:hypothetical protein
MNITTGSNVLRASNPGLNPEVSKVVSEATNLSLDLQGIKNLQDQVARVAVSASNDAQALPASINSSTTSLIKHMKELVMSYVYTYDNMLSPGSEIAWTQDVPDVPHTKDVSTLKSRIAAKLDVPSIPGNLFYVACRDNVQDRNLDLYDALTSYRQLNPTDLSSDTELIASNFMPRFLFPGYNSLPDSLKTRWGSIASNTATSNFTINNQSITLDPSLHEVVAIAGLRTVSDYLAFSKILYLDNILKNIKSITALRLITFYTESGVSGTSVDLWLAQGKLALNNSSSLLGFLYNFFATKKSSDYLTNLITWLTSEVTLELDPNIPEISNDPDLISLISLSRSLGSDVINGHSSIMQSLGISTGDLNYKKNIVTTLLSSWATRLQVQGGNLGYQAALLCAAITGLDRLAAAVDSDNSDQIKKCAADGLELCNYITNASSLQSAFEALST